jgi:hypothetical protein
MTARSLLAAAALGSTLAGVTPLAAQTADSTAAPRRSARWELLVPAGRIVPTGAQRGAIKRGNLSAVQLAYVPRPALAFTATVGWARSRDLAAANDPKLDVFTYDVGAEVRAPRWGAGTSATFMPFAGLGAGVRSYNYRSLDVDATHNPAAYAAAGAELGVRRVRVRVEARDYVTGFKPLAGGGTADTRNDVVVMAGLRLTRHGR